MNFLRTTFRIGNAAFFAKWLGPDVWLSFIVVAGTLAFQPGDGGVDRVWLTASRIGFDFE